MIRRPRTGSPASAAGTLTGRVARRVGGAVVGAGVGALAAWLAVTGSADPASLLQDAVTPDRTADRPTRALDRDAEPSGGLADRLLPAAALTSPSSELAWGVVHTERHEPRTLAGSCHRFPLVSVGALRVAHRAYVLGRPRAPKATAVHVVARFADSRTAWRAQAVLLAWRADCGETLADRPGVRLTGLHDLDGAQRYAVSWSPAGAERVREDVALVRVGSRLALLRTSSSGHDLGPAVVADGATSARELLSRPR